VQLHSWDALDLPIDFFVDDDNALDHLGDSEYLERAPTPVDTPASPPPSGLPAPLAPVTGTVTKPEPVWQDIGADAWVASLAEPVLSSVPAVPVKQETAVKAEPAPRAQPPACLWTSSCASVACLDAAGVTVAVMDPMGGEAGAFAGVGVGASTVAPTPTPQACLDGSSKLRLHASCCTAFWGYLRAVTARDPGPVLDAANTSALASYVQAVSEGLESYKEEVLTRGVCFVCGKGLAVPVRASTAGGQREWEEFGLHILTSRRAVDNSLDQVDLPSGPVPLALVLHWALKRQVGLVRDKKLRADILKDEVARRLGQPSLRLPVQAFLTTYGGASATTGTEHSVVPDGLAAALVSLMQEPGFWDVASTKKRGRVPAVAAAEGAVASKGKRRRA
jgi:hypothetical protein